MLLLLGPNLNSAKSRFFLSNAYTKLIKKVLLFIKLNYRSPNTKPVNCKRQKHISITVPSSKEMHWENTDSAVMLLSPNVTSGLIPPYI